MTVRKQIYRCNVCGNMVEITQAGAGQLICCGQPMELLAEKTSEEGTEKHLPVIEKTGKQIKVKVGSVPHPMEAAHFIQWIELIAGEKSQRQFLNPSQTPEAVFEIEEKADRLEAREYCNLHGLWASRNQERP